MSQKIDTIITCCPNCSRGKESSEFQKLIESKVLGITLYRYVMHPQSFRSTIKGGDASSTVDTNDIFILHNTKNNEISAVDYIPALDSNFISCLRCQQVAKRAQTLLQNTDTIGKKGIQGICNHCLSRQAHLQFRHPCFECQEIVKRFAASKGIIDSPLHIGPGALLKSKSDDKTRLPSPSEILMDKMTRRTSVSSKRDYKVEEMFKSSEPWEDSRWSIVESDINVKTKKTSTSEIDEESKLKFTGKKELKFGEISEISEHKGNLLETIANLDIKNVKALIYNIINALKETEDDAGTKIQNANLLAGKTDEELEQLVLEIIKSANSDTAALVFHLISEQEKVNLNLLGMKKRLDQYHFISKVLDSPEAKFSEQQKLDQQSKPTTSLQEIMTRKQGIAAIIRKKIELRQTKESLQTESKEIYPGDEHKDSLEEPEMLSSTKARKRREFASLEKLVHIKVINETNELKDKARQVASLIRTQVEQQRKRSLQSLGLVEYAKEQRRKKLPKSMLTYDVPKEEDEKTLNLVELLKKKIQKGKKGDLEVKENLPSLKSQKLFGQILTESEIELITLEKKIGSLKTSSPEAISPPKELKPSLKRAQTLQKILDPSSPQHDKSQLQETKTKLKPRIATRSSTKPIEDLKEKKEKKKRYRDEQKEKEKKKINPEKTETQEKTAVTQQPLEEPEVDVAKIIQEKDALIDKSDKIEEDKKKVKPEQTETPEKIVVTQQPLEEPEIDLANIIQKKKALIDERDKIEEKKEKDKVKPETTETEQKITTTVDHPLEKPDKKEQKQSEVSKKRQKSTKGKESDKVEPDQNKKDTDGKDADALAKSLNKVLTKQDKNKLKSLKLQEKHQKKEDKFRSMADKASATKSGPLKLPTIKFKEKPKSKENLIKGIADLSPKDLAFRKVKMGKPSSDDLILRLVKIRLSKTPRRADDGTARLLEMILSKKHAKRKLRHDDKIESKVDSDYSLDLESLLADRAEENEMIAGEKILNPKETANYLSLKAMETGPTPDLFKAVFEVPFQKEEISFVPAGQPAYKHKPKAEPPKLDLESTGVLRYRLSDTTFIENGWTQLPTQKVFRKENVYRMHPAHPEFNWFLHNKHKGFLYYDTGELLASFDEFGHGRWFYKTGSVALDFYDAQETSGTQRVVIYSSGEPDRGRPQPITILASFDYCGNGMVLDHAGNIRLKYNQTEGFLLDKKIGPVSHWKWHALNEPPIIQQQWVDTKLSHPDPVIQELCNLDKAHVRKPDDKERIAIELENSIKDKRRAVGKEFKPYPIRTKTLKMNKQFSVRVLDQANVFITFRDGPTKLKMNIGMILDPTELLDIEYLEVKSQFDSYMEQLPPPSESLNRLQRQVANAKKNDRALNHRVNWLRQPLPADLSDQLSAVLSRPLRPPLRTLPQLSTNSLRCNCN